MVFSLASPHSVIKSLLTVLSDKVSIASLSHISVSCTNDSFPNPQAPLYCFNYIHTEDGPGKTTTGKINLFPSLLIHTGPKLEMIPHITQMWTSLWLSLEIVKHSGILCLFCLGKKPDRQSFHPMSIHPIYEHSLYRLLEFKMRFKIAFSCITYIKFSHLMLKEGKYPARAVLQFYSKDSKIHFPAFQKYFLLLLWLLLSKTQGNYLLIKTWFNMLAEKLIPLPFSALKQMKHRKEVSCLISEMRSRYFFKFSSLPSVIFM